MVPSSGRTALSGLLMAAMLLLAPASAGAQQSPLGSADFQRILGEVRVSVSQMKEQMEKHRNLNRRLEDWKGRKATHEANRCYYPAGQPQVCATYDQEARNLEAEYADMARQEAAMEQAFNYARSHHQILMGRLRIAVFLGCLRPFAADIHDCAALEDAEAAAACLTAVWERHC